MSGYVFIGNSSKPSVEKNNSREPVKPGNVSIPCIEAALKLGYEVYLGTNRNNPQELECTYPVKLFDAHSYRSITAFNDNRVAYSNLSKVVEEGNVEVIHCNTPVGGMIGRLVGKRHHIKKIIYTAHGFHFYKGAPLFNRTVLKWAEQIMAHWTDVIITMNEEDFQSAKKFKLRKGGKVYYVPGVGINTEEFFNVRINKKEKRDELGIAMDDIICISMGDLIPRKNYETSIKAIALCNNPKVHYLICGRGPELDNLKKLAKELGVENQIHFLGFRTDIKELSKVADIFLFTTLQEGMPRSMMEAMASGLPCIASKIRGNVDLLEEGIGGYLIPAKDENAVADRLERLVENLDLREEMRKANLERIKGFDIGVVKSRMEEIYKEVLNK